MNTALEKKVISACNNERDYSIRFENKVKSIQKSAEDFFNTVVDVDDDMDYGASNRLTFYFDKKSRIISSAENYTKEERWVKADYFVEVLISSLGDFYWSRVVGKKKILGLTMKKNATRTEGFSSEVLQNKSKVDDFIENLGFQSIPEILLGKIVPGKKTDLDGSPATVFDIIFSEI